MKNRDILPLSLSALILGSMILTFGDIEWLGISFLCLALIGFAYLAVIKLKR